MNEPVSTAAGSVSPMSRPLGGTHPSLYQKTYSSSCPSQNTGIDTPTIATNIDTLLAAERRLMPAKTPMGMPTANQITAAPNASVAVTGNRLAISSLTGTKLP